MSNILTPNAWPAMAAATAALALAGAHFTEHVLGYAPCRLCVVQRWAYWGALILAMTTALALAARPNLALARLTCIALGLTFAAGASVAAYHAGVEWGVFPDPGCESGGGQRLTPEDIRAMMGEASTAQSCADPPFVLPFKDFGLSMAGWNCVLALTLAGLSLWSAFRPASKPALSRTEPLAP